MKKLPADIKTLSDVLDQRFKLPGTNFRFGIDPIIGLIPGVGDLASSSLNLYIIYRSYLLGARKRSLLIMGKNYLVDTVVGAIPLVGDIFDFAYKANVKNIKLLEAELGRHEMEGRSIQSAGKLIAGLVVFGAMAVTLILIALVISLLSLIF